MNDTEKIICFTDIKDSTKKTEELGNQGIRESRDYHLNLGKTLCELSGGKYIKSNGDSHVVTFESLEPALIFCTQLQQFYESNEYIQEPPFEVRVGLCFGIVDDTGTDILGNGANFTARVEGEANPKEILVDSHFVSSIRKVWGAQKTTRFFETKGPYTLKGISDPPDQFLSSFKWKLFYSEYPNQGLSNIVFNYFQTLSIVPSNLFVSDISKPTRVIWPVVPRDLVNAIHRGQIEIIRLLSLLGWGVTILIADGGAINAPPKKYSQDFQIKLESYISFRGLRNVEYEFMSDLYEPRCIGCDIFHKHFQKVISDFTLNDLLEINEKDYEDSIKEAIQRSATLDFLKPALIISSVLSLAESYDKKCIVVVGHDEKIQWQRAHDIPDFRDSIGILFNPILKTNLGHQAHQTRNWPFWDSKLDLENEMRDENIARWLIKLHLFLPRFPMQNIVINNQIVNITNIDQVNIADLGLQVLSDMIFDGVLMHNHQ